VPKKINAVEKKWSK